MNIDGTAKNTAVLKTHGGKTKQDDVTFAQNYI
jgi:hypothetical protein